MSRRIALAAVVLAALALAAEARPAASPTLRISFPEGFTVARMADRVAAVRRIAIRKRHVRPALTGLAYRHAAAATDPPPGFPGAKRIEGFLFPSLYVFGPSTTAKELIARQLDAFALDWKKLDLRAVERYRHVTAYDVLIVASMVERETVAPEERALVAAVIYNRLAKGMPLGIDATIRYGLGIQGTKALTVAELLTDSPYNTRLHAGLPPTPIGSPGLASMRAAAQPAHVGYLYYVREPDGIHHFFTADYATFCAKAKEFGYSC